MIPRNYAAAVAAALDVPHLRKKPHFRPPTRPDAVKHPGDDRSYLEKLYAIADALYGIPQMGKKNKKPFPWDFSQ